jgi:hypothetical protein
LIPIQYRSKADRPGGYALRIATATPGFSSQTVVLRKNLAGPRIPYGEKTRPVTALSNEFFLPSSEKTRLR